MTKEELQKKKVSAISLGCDKNKVDLEKMLGRLKEYGFNIVLEPTEADIVIVNTCAFIRPAEQEAIDNILEMEALKKMGVIEKLFVTGCFPERHYFIMKENFPDLDGYLKVRENDTICQVIEDSYGLELSKVNKSESRVLTNPNSYAYLKIADGCNNACSYCTIPRIRGRYISRSIDEIVDEAKELVKMGVKEIILVAQDTTRYGEDLYGEGKLIDLCKKLTKIKNLQWLRFHYAYPEKVSKELLLYIATEPKMCKYIDIPLQHIDEGILKSMRRRLDEEKTRKLVNLIKSSYPEIKIRSTFIIGYPSERRKEYKKLFSFIKETQMDYVGFFPYSREPNTASYYLKKQVPTFIKKIRLNRLKKLQQNISTEKAKALIGSEMSVLVDYFDENRGEFVGHGKNLSPLVDFGVRFVDNGSVQTNSFVSVKIFDFDGNDFIGECI